MLTGIMLRGALCLKSHQSFLQGDCNFKMEILYLGDFFFFFVPLRFSKYERGRELNVVVCVNSLSYCLNPCAKCPLWMLQGGRGKAAVSAVVIIDPLKRAALILHVTASWKFR